MFRLVNTRVIVQRDTTNKTKYYPRLVAASTMETFPWSCPVATIEIDSNVTSGTAGYMSAIRVDDIIRLQVDIRYSTSEKSGWQDLFEGRIMAIESGLGTDNNTVLHCRGHGEEMLYSMVTADYSASSSTTGAILNGIRSLYLTRLTNGSSLIDTTSSTSITSYNTQQDTKFVADDLHELEALESYGYVFSVKCSYDSSRNLTAADMSWQPVSSTASSKVKIIEGTGRFIEASFKPTIEQLVNDITVYGASGAPQKVGTASDATSQTEYDIRYHVETDKTLTTDALCSALATAIKARYKDPLTQGFARIVGDPNIVVGDLVYCRIPSIDVNGSSIDGNYRVRRVVHTINQNAFVTSLDLGEPDLSPYELIAGFHAKNRLNNAQFID